MKSNNNVYVALTAGEVDGWESLHFSYTLKFSRFIMLQLTAVLCVLISAASILTTVLCILISAASIWYALTPPQPPPLEGEYAEWTVLECILGQRYILFTLNVSHKNMNFWGQPLTIQFTVPLSEFFCYRGGSLHHPTCTRSPLLPIFTLLLHFFRWQRGTHMCLPSIHRWNSDGNFWRNN